MTLLFNFTTFKEEQTTVSMSGKGTNKFVCITVPQTVNGVTFDQVFCVKCNLPVEVKVKMLLPELPSDRLKHVPAFTMAAPGKTPIQTDTSNNPAGLQGSVNPLFLHKLI